MRTRFVGKRRTFDAPPLDWAGERRMREDEDGEEIARYPGHYSAVREGSELVIYGGDPPEQQETDLYDMNTDARKARDHRPHTLAELNAFLAHHYGRHGRRAMPVR